MVCYMHYACEDPVEAARLARLFVNGPNAEPSQISLEGQRLALIESRPILSSTAEIVLNCSSFPTRGASERAISGILIFPLCLVSCNLFCGREATMSVVRQLPRGRGEGRPTIFENYNNHTMVYIVPPKRLPFCPKTRPVLEPT
jgi:hypothetical protein